MTDSRMSASLRSHAPSCPRTADSASAKSRGRHLHHRIAHFSIAGSCSSNSTASDMKTKMQSWGPACHACA